MAGLGILNTWKFVDVFGLDPELLVMVPQPVAAVLLLYPLNKKVFHIIKQPVRGAYLFSRKFS